MINYAAAEKPRDVCVTRFSSITDTDLFVGLIITVVFN